MTAADKPGADLVALFDAFARMPEGRTMLTLFGDEHGAPMRAWAAEHGYQVREAAMYNQRDGRWTMLEVRLAAGWITVHLDSVQEQPEVKPTGTFRCDHCRSFIAGPAGAQCPFEHWPVGYAVEIEQPAAEGSV